MIAEEQKKKFMTMTGILVGAFLFTLLPFPEEYSKQAIYMMAIALVGAGFWMTECLPIPVTALVIILLQALFGIQHISSGLSFIASPVNSIVFAGFVMATALSKYNLDRRVGLGIVNIMGENTERLVLGIMISTAFLSMWISNSAAAAIMVPISIGILKMADITVESKSNLAKVMMLGIAFSANIGGMGTPAGTTVCPITIAFINDLVGVQLKFLDWVMMGTPVVMLLVPTAWRILLLVYPLELKRIEGGTEAVKQELLEMGPLTAKQKHVAALFIIAIILWILDSFVQLMPGWLYVSSVIIALMFMAPGIGVVSWNEAAKDMGWGIFILVGGGLALGNGLKMAGVIDIIAGSLGQALTGANIYVVISALTFITALSITFFSSITATSTTFVPVAIGLAVQLGFDPVGIGAAVGLSACLAFLLPANTPPNAIVYAPGYFKTSEMTKAGILVTIAAVSILTLMVNLLWAGRF
jgi:sodium-dependent dicarboxylate transporter 2/3/5